jgi:hypothetical protein
VLSGTVHVSGDHIVLENLEIRDGAPTCLTHAGHDLVVRDTAVHDCPNHGILGTDVGSGSLLLERVEVYNCASVQTGNRKHQIYIATDEVAHPGAVFRMELSYVHDCGSGGSNVKSRAERTELYSNWIENGGLYELELYGPDEDFVPNGWHEDLAREDADVAGNVFHRTENQDTSFLFRIGGDGSSQLGDAGNNDSKGRVRFAHNTIVVPDGTGIFRTFNRVESIEVHNNVFFAAGGELRMLEDDASWVGGRQVVAGDHNWMSDGATDVPAEWNATLTGSDPQLADPAALDFHPIEESPLVDAGASPTVSPAGYEFPNPLSVPKYHPPPAKVLAAADVIARPTVGVVDIGAFEYGVAPPQPPDGGNNDGGSNGGSSNDGAPNHEDGEDPSSPVAEEEGGCRVGASDASNGAWMLLALLFIKRRRRW